MSRALSDALRDIMPIRLLKHNKDKFSSYTTGSSNSMGICKNK